jgi:hypothetical protein
MFVASVLVILGMMGLALDLSMLYNRKAEMQNLANTVALAAAVELNGSSAGVTQALQRASERLVTFPNTVVGGMSYQYSTRTMSWSNAAIEFGATPTGPWVSAATAQLQAGGILYAKVDTSNLDAAYGKVEALFANALGRTSAFVSTTGRAVAGRTAVRVTPLGICAMRTEAARDHGGELEEFGFRRGVAYDLMQLNPDSTTTGASFLINPLVAPGAPGVAQPATADEASPYVCTGTMAMARVTGGDVSVSAPFPLDQLYSSFNSRFSASALPCRPETAPPDVNIREYKYNDSSVPWMDGAPSGQAAAESLADGKRWTVVGPDVTPTTTTAGMYGPLWSYAKAARFSSYMAGAAEPVAGYTTFGTTDWTTLYYQGKPKAKSYPASPPYFQTSATYAARPAGTTVRGRRVLNIPLLACPVTGDRARIRAVGKFFMTVQAKSDQLIGEFGGIVPEQTLGTLVKLYP